MKFCIADSNNLAQRTKHAIKNFSTVDDCVGMILQGFFGSLHKSYVRFGSKHCVACFDAPRSWRRDIYPEYKTKEDKTLSEMEIHRDEAVKIALVELQEFLEEHTNVTVLKADTLEADDFIGRWAQLHEDPMFSHIIISSDGDFRQLITRPGIEMYNPLHGILYTTEGVYVNDGKKAARGHPFVRKYGEKWKIKLNKNTGEPETFDAEWELFFKCIRGDTSDTIKSAYPNVFETTMRKAFNDRGGPEWNNFLLKTWGKNKILVRDRYDFNKSLIDLSQQPENIKLLMEETIERSLDQPVSQMVGAYFAKYCSKHRLHRLQSQASSITRLLAAPYE